MSAPNYRVDVFQRINARLKAAVEAERYTVACEKCLSKFDLRHFVGCPYCASTVHRERRATR